MKNRQLIKLIDSFRGNHSDEIDKCQLYKLFAVLSPFIFEKQQNKSSKAKTKNTKYLTRKQKFFLDDICAEYLTFNSNDTLISDYLKDSTEAKWERMLDHLMDVVIEKLRIPFKIFDPNFLSSLRPRFIGKKEFETSWTKIKFLKTLGASLTEGQLHQLDQVKIKEVGFPERKGFEPLEDNQPNLFSNDEIETYEDTSQESQYIDRNIAEGIESRLQKRTKLEDFVHNTSSTILRKHQSRYLKLRKDITICTKDDYREQQCIDTQEYAPSFSRTAENLTLYKIGNNQNSAIRIRNKSVEQSYYSNVEIKKFIRNNLLIAKAKLAEQLSGYLEQDLDQFILTTIEFAQEHNGVGNAGESKWNEYFNIHKSNCKMISSSDKEKLYSFKNASMFSALYQSESFKNEIFSGREENLRKDKKVGARLMRIPKEFNDEILTLLNTGTIVKEKPEQEFSLKFVLNLDKQNQRAWKSSFNYRAQEYISELHTCELSTQHLPMVCAIGGMCLL